ncbi:MAG: GcrA cell cycle regulator [Salaquimonas sp.]|jgi:GcrA cell cycle regulator|nr:GcrA cell cycle regulator [Salaquimonas sp.]
MSWTDERVELLKKLWMEGLSASQIAAELGSVTRNAVIGKVHRLGLSGRAKTSSTAARPKRPPRSSSFGGRPARNTHRKNGSHYPLATSTQRSAPPVAIEAPEPLKLKLIELTEQTCKWPIGDPAQDDFHFCGHKTKDAGPYCAYHAQLAYQPVVDRRRDRRNDASA